MGKTVSRLTLLMGVIFYMSCGNLPEDQKTQSPKINGYSSYPLPESLSIFGEKMPLDKAYVQEALDLELLKNTYWHSNTLLMLKRRTLYFPTIDSILEAEKIPLDFRYLAAAESNLDPTIVSPARAKGLWQFLPGTATDMGLEVSEEVDERSHIVKSTQAAVKYLKMLKDSTQNWSLAAASYNAGLGNIRKAINLQKPKGNANYFDLELFRETERYLYRIAALKLIFTNPSAYGFAEEKGYVRAEVKKMPISQSIPDLYAWCNEKKISIRELRYLNPWLIGGALTVSQPKSYTLLLPKN